MLVGLVRLWPTQNLPRNSVTTKPSFLNCGISIEYEVNQRGTHPFPPEHLCTDRCLCEQFVLTCPTSSCTGYRNSLEHSISQPHLSACRSVTTSDSWLRWILLLLWMFSIQDPRGIESHWFCHRCVPTTRREERWMHGEASFDDTVRCQFSSWNAHDSGND